MPWTLEPPVGSPRPERGYTDAWFLKGAIRRAHGYLGAGHRPRHLHAAVRGEATTRSRGRHGQGDPELQAGAEQPRGRRDAAAEADERSFERAGYPGRRDSRGRAQELN